MAWIEFNNNPVGRRVGDCAVRAISKALDTDWESAYISLVRENCVKLLKSTECVARFPQVPYR